VESKAQDIQVGEGYNVGSSKIRSSVLKISKGGMIEKKESIRKKKDSEFSMGLKTINQGVTMERVKKGETQPGLLSVGGNAREEKGEGGGTYPTARSESPGGGGFAWGQQKFFGGGRTRGSRGSLELIKARKEKKKGRGSILFVHHK